MKTSSLDVLHAVHVVREACAPDDELIVACKYVLRYSRHLCERDMASLLLEVLSVGQSHP